MALVKTTEDYQAKVERIEQEYEKRKAAAHREKGLIIVFTERGRARATAAFGMLFLTAD